MALIWILAGTVIAGVGSVWIAAMLSFGIMARLTKHMLSFAAGALLSTALLQLLPEALAAGISADACLPSSWQAWCFSLFWTKPSSTTMATSMVSRA